MDGVFKKSERRWKGKHTAGGNVAFEMYNALSECWEVINRVSTGWGLERRAATEWEKNKFKASISKKGKMQEKRQRWIFAF
jgi:hypothetical protein